MKLECPYCKNHLIKGFIGNFHNGSFKWYDENLKLFQKLTVFGGELLKESITGKSECYRCESCNKIIIDLDEE